MIDPPSVPCRAEATFLIALLAPALAACAAPMTRFADSPVVWNEHDDAHVPRAPRERRLEDQKVTLAVKDFFTREVDRRLSLPSPAPAADVNALDEVPCSTWFCPRNHLRRMSTATIAAGPPSAVAPTLPIGVVKGKLGGVSTGFQVVDAVGRKYLVKLDPPGHPRLASGAEVVGTLIFHAAGYNVPGAFALELGPRDVHVAPGATKLLSGVAERPFTDRDLGPMLLGAARSSSGKATAVAIPWLPGKTLGGFDMAGRRSDDPNDRIPHEDRRSLRGALVLFAWLDVYDASSINTLDTYVEESGRRFVRHHIIDFGSGLGSSAMTVKSVYDGRERIIEVARMMTAFFTLGLAQRPWQQQATRWREDSERTPAVGWFGPDDGWDIDQFRTGRKIPAHQRMTTADWFWGAKLVASFSDRQLAAIVDTAGYDDVSAALIRSTLIARRDRIVRRLLATVTACEAPALSDDHRSLCFDDALVSGGYAAARRVMYTVQVTDQDGAVRATARQPAQGSRTCVPLPETGDRPEYLIATLESIVDGRRARPARVHLRWRAREGRFVVVGLERDDP